MSQSAQNDPNKRRRGETAAEAKERVRREREGAGRTGPKRKGGQERKSKGAER